VNISNYSSDNLRIDSLQFEKGQSWCFYGSNVSGIDQLSQIFTDNQANPFFSNSIAVISFAKQQEIFESELRNDDTDFIDRIDPGTPAHHFITNPSHNSELISALNLSHCLEKGYRQLSSGESRKLLILSAISKNPSMVFIENPYDGIDLIGCSELDRTFTYLCRHGQLLVITVNNRCDIPSWCSHLGIFQKGELICSGKREQVLRDYNFIAEKKQLFPLEELTIPLTAQSPEEQLVQLHNGSARYGEKIVFSGLNLAVHDGQHTLFTGPNGSGKSTLLHMLAGDNQNCYANDLYLFGIKRGSGESIWDLKKQMGIVSPEIHRNHYIPGSALQVVISGYFDSIGVYQQVSSFQKKEALRWLQMVGLPDHSTISFRKLSYAEQRLCLIARGLIKMPRLLLLDEPTQGLDDNNRENLLDFLEAIGQMNISTILYASHRTDEFRSFFQQHIDLALH